MDADESREYHKKRSRHGNALGLDYREHCDGDATNADDGELVIGGMDGDVDADVWPYVASHLPISSSLSAFSLC